MKISAAEVLRKMGAPLPGAAGFPPRPKMQPPSPQPTDPTPRIPGDEPPVEEAVAPEQEPGAQEGPQSVQQIVQRLGEHFSDDKISDINDSMLTLMKVVPPDTAEKVAKVFTKLMEAMMALKANIVALQVMSMPAQQQNQMMQRNLEQLNQAAGQGAAGQGIKSGPIT